MSETDVARSANVTEPGDAGDVVAPEETASPNDDRESADLVDEFDDESDESDDSDDSDDSDESEEDSEEDGDGGPAGSGRRGRRGVPSLKRLEEEGEVAADYLEELLDITDLDGDIDIDVENGRASVAIVAESSDRELRRLVGARGEVLEALQELSRLAVQARTGERSRLMLDVAGFRAARRRTLEDVAALACQEVQRAGQPVRLEPMSAFERKVVHDVVAGAGLRSESEGEEPGRRVVVFPVSA